MARNMKLRPEQDTVAQLEAIKRLLVLWLVKNGIAQKDVAAALGLDNSTVSRMFPKGVLKRVGAAST